MHVLDGRLDIGQRSAIVGEQLSELAKPLHSIAEETPVEVGGGAFFVLVEHHLGDAEGHRQHGAVALVDDQDSFAVDPERSHFSWERVSGGYADGEVCRAVSHRPIEFLEDSVLAGQVDAAGVLSFDDDPPVGGERHNEVADELLGSEITFEVPGTFDNTTGASHCCAEGVFDGIFEIEPLVRATVGLELLAAFVHEEIA